MKTFDNFKLNSKIEDYIFLIKNKTEVLDARYVFQNIKHEKKLPLPSRHRFPMSYV